jgi:hypothetical protein
MRFPLPATALLCLVCALCISAQVVTEETVVTDSVDLSIPKEQATKSPGLAMAATILLPGLGHQYLGKQQSAFAYFSAEALFVVGAVFCEQYSAKVFKNTRSYAWVYGMASGGPGADERYWQRVGDYLDSRKYNEDQELNRTPEAKYVAENLQWRWADESYMKDYRSMRADATTFHVASSFFLGAMVLDRIVSFIDVRASTRDRGFRKTAAVSVRPTLSGDFSTVGMRLSSSF